MDGVDVPGLAAEEMITGRWFRTAFLWAVLMTRAEAADIWPTDTVDPTITLARIQSDLERTAAGRPRWLLPEGVTVDPLERIVDAYAAFLKEDPNALDTALSDVLNSVMKRRAKLQARDPKYFDAIDSALTAPLPLQRLIAGLREVDSILFLDAAKSRGDVLLEIRKINIWGWRDPLDDTWLRLPCRTAIGRADDLAQAELSLGTISGPLLACPISGSDFKIMAMKAEKPGELTPRLMPAPVNPTQRKRPAAVNERDRAIEDMGAHPDKAGPVLEAAAKQDDVGRVDYALFIHAFRPKTKKNKATIIRLLAPALEGDNDSADDPYDGTDASLLRILSRASLPASYIIPCAILLARPPLAEAIDLQPYGTMINSIPASGCATGRGHIQGFPEEKVSQFVRAAADADGNYIRNYIGSNGRWLAALQQENIERLKVNPRGLLDRRIPDLDYPYQTWGMTGAVAHRTSEHIKPLYFKALRALTQYNIRRGLSRSDAGRAAKAGLFQAVFGADCGHARPKRSIRGMLVEKAPVKAILSRLDLPEEGEAPEVLKCAPVEPLIHVAVVHSSALAALLDRGKDIEEPNSFEKTPLMEAAQLDELESVRLLLKRHAQINAITEGELAHDARSPLMYAAANASLAMIKLLLSAGADPFQADSKGSRAIDYLLGYGPSGPNPNLTAGEMAEAARLLF